MAPQAGAGELGLRSQEDAGEQCSAIQEAVRLKGSRVKCSTGMGWPLVAWWTKASEGPRACGVRGQSDVSTAPPLCQTQSHFFNEHQGPTCRQNINTNAFAQYQLHVGWMAELTVTRTMRNTRLSVHGCAFTQLRAAVHGRVPGGFPRPPAEKTERDRVTSSLLRHRPSQGNALTWPKASRPVTRAVCCL